MPAQQDRNSLNSYSSPVGTPEMFAYLPEIGNVRRAYPKTVAYAYQTVNPASGCHNCDPGDWGCEFGKFACEIEQGRKKLWGDTSQPAQAPGQTIQDAAGATGKAVTDALGAAFAPLTDFFTKPCYGFFIPCGVIAAVGIGVIAMVALIRR